MPRIIAGIAKGLRIEAPKGDKTRPTTDRVKESLFNILMPDIYGSNVLDLFSGSGSLGLECLSRGAKKCHFNDLNRRALQLIKKNADHCKLSEKAEFTSMNYVSLLEALGSKDEKFNLIFLDPPYGTGMLQNAIDLIVQFQLFGENAIIIAEHPSDEVVTQNENVEVYRVVKYGEITMSLIKSH